jgi:hypothetical protein
MGVHLPDEEVHVAYDGDRARMIWIFRMHAPSLSEQKSDSGVRHWQDQFTC